jgi:hypothetical protein
VRWLWQKQRSICFCLELFVTFSFKRKSKSKLHQGKKKRKKNFKKDEYWLGYKLNVFFNMSFDTSMQRPAEAEPTLLK